jgi:hypothetical protein
MPHQKHPITQIGILFVVAWNLARCNLSKSGLVSAFLLFTVVFHPEEDWVVGLNCPVLSSVDFYWGQISTGTRYQCPHSPVLNARIEEVAEFVDPSSWMDREV